MANTAMAAEACGKWPYWTGYGSDYFRWYDTQIDLQDLPQKTWPDLDGCLRMVKLRLFPSEIVRFWEKWGNSEVVSDAEEFGILTDRFCPKARVFRPPRALRWAGRGRWRPRSPRAMCDYWGNSRAAGPT